MIIYSEVVLVSLGMSVAVDWTCSVGLVPRTLICAMRGYHLLLHCSIICINGSWLSPTLFVSLGLVFQPLCVLLVCLNQLNFFLGSLVSRILILICLLLILHCNLLLSYTVRIWWLERWWYRIHAKLHEVWLAQVLILIGIFGCLVASIVLNLWWCSAATQIDIWLLIHLLSSSWLRYHGAIDIALNI